MKCVYSPSSSVEAHMIVHLLEQSDIRGFIHGEALVGAAGELPVNDLIRINVVDEDYDRAREIILEWEKQNPSPQAIPEPTKTSIISKVLLAFITGGILGWLGNNHWQQINYVFNDTVTIDQNNDGKEDVVYHYKSGKNTYPDYVKYDRNFDGKFDRIDKIDEYGAIVSSKSDIDSNGAFETITQYKNGIETISESDSNADGKPDLISDAMLKQSKILDLDTGKPIRINYYDDFGLKSSDFDADGDGILETHYTYDRAERIIKTTKDQNHPTGK